MRKLIALVLAAILCASLATACSGAPGAEQGGSDPIYIASANPMTGDSAQYGDCKVKAIELALQEVNDAGGIDGRKVELLVGDDTGNPTEAPNVAQKFATDNRVLAVIGHWNSSCTLAAREIYDGAGIPVITDSVNKAITDGSCKTMFRISLTDTEQATLLADYAYHIMGVRRAGIMYTANDFGTGLQSDFSAAFTALGGTITTAETYFEGQTKDFSAQLTKIKQTDPELLFVAGYYTECALIAQQRLTSDLNIPILGTDGISSDALIELGGDAVEGVTFGGFFHPDLAYTGTAEFVQSYRDAYGKDPDTYAALAYDSAKMILEGMKTEGATREGILKYLREVKEFPGIAGPVSFDENGAASRNVVVLVIRDGKICLAENQPGGN